MILNKIQRLIGSVIYSFYIRISCSNFKKCKIYYPIHLTGEKYIKVGKNFSCQRRVRLEAIYRDGYNSNNILIEIGNNVFINWDCHIGAIRHIKIGNNVLIGSRVMIIDHQHGEINFPALLTPPADRPLWSKGPIDIKDNVWIGEGCAILPGVCIGMNSIIGANSVVTKDVPPNCVVAGNPAKIIKRLRPT